jgi:outer membrane immunogenic protein
MMRLKFLAAIALALLSLSATAHAADIYRSRAPYTVQQPLNVYSWAGPYIGGNVGYQWGDITNNGASPSGFAGGVQGGYNWQFGQWVLGAEADLQASGANDTFAAWKFSNPWFGTLRGRAGFAMNNILIYGTGGLAFGSVRAEVLNLTESHAAAGWTLGVGAEIGITQNWTAKAEYLYVNLNNSQFALTGLPNGYQFSVVRLGVNYKF